MAASPERIQQIWLGKLHSFDNRTLFQAIAEIISVGHMVQYGWTIEGCHEHSIRLNHPISGQLDLFVVSLILDRDLEQEKILQQELVQALNTLQSTYRVGLTIRTPLFPHVDIPKIVGVTKKWLAKAHAKPDQKQRRVGHVKDALCHLDFRIIGPKEQLDESTVYLVTPPVIGQRLQRHISQMMSQSIEALRQQRSQKDDVPVFLSVVANQSMTFRKSGKELLYGLSHEESQGSTILDTRHWWVVPRPIQNICGGVLCVEQTLDHTRDVPCFDAITFANPWCEFHTVQSSLPLPAYRYSRVQPTDNSSPYSKASWILQKAEGTPAL